MTFSVARTCRHFGLSRQAFYKWKDDLFEGDLTDEDKLVYVNNVIKGKLLASETLQQQAANNTKEQFACCVSDA